MIRYNYDPSPFERRFGPRLGSFWDDRYRTPLIVVGLALCTVAMLSLIEVRRLAALENDLTVARRQTAALSVPATRARALGEAVRQERARHDALAAMERESREVANEVATIANRLPERTWLTALRDEGGSWSISGRSTRLPEIAALLRRVGAGEVDAAQLVSVTAVGRDHDALDFVIAVERRR